MYALIAIALCQSLFVLTLSCFLTLEFAPSAPTKIFVPNFMVSFPFLISTTIFLSRSSSNATKLKPSNTSTSKSFAKFSISAMMFNHVVSGLEAVWANRNKDSEIIKEEKKLDLDLGLFFDGNNAFGVGGLSLRMNF